MPLIHLQTTANLIENPNVEDILGILVAALCEMETVQPAAVKAFHSLRSVWAMGSGAEPGFANCTVSILQGRPEDLRIRIADHMVAALRSCFAQSIAAGEVNITLEVREMAAATYRK